VAKKRTAGGKSVTYAASVAALHLTASLLRGTVQGRSDRIQRMHMRNIATPLKRLGLVGFGLAGLVALVAFARPAQAANPFEMNFGLFGPKYEGRIKPCEAALGTITSQFQEKESTFWNSPLTITAYGNIHEIAFRPWQSDNIPRRYCTGHAVTSDGKVHTLNYSIIEDGGFASFGQGVEWCVIGLDRNWAYNPACRAAGP
jgi:hypothetical protein